MEASVTVAACSPDVGPEAKGKACFSAVMLLPAVHSAHVDFKKPSWRWPHDANSLQHTYRCWQLNNSAICILQPLQAFPVNFATSQVHETITALAARLKRDDGRSLQIRL